MKKNIITSCIILLIAVIVLGIFYVRVSSQGVVIINFAKHDVAKVEVSYDRKKDETKVIMVSKRGYPFALNEKVKTNALVIDLIDPGLVPAVIVPSYYVTVKGKFSVVIIKRYE